MGKAEDTCRLHKPNLDSVLFKKSGQPTQAERRSDVIPGPYSLGL